ncbi:MAG: TraR/DksA family transcriptional regulator, partial [Bdellovibrionales bacterium]|nr:TraR/DksA family transcriptional regulator [Bdellovibrionales bacterium]
MEELKPELVQKCKVKLIDAKADILNRVREAKENLNKNFDDAKGGDEGDQTLRALAETEFLNMNERLRKQLVEIEMALARIESGSYGICEET